MALLTDRVASYHWTSSELRSLLLQQSQAMGRAVLAIEALDRPRKAAA